MKFTESELAGAWIIEPQKHEDERGYFARLRCSREFGERGLPAGFVQTNLSYNSHRGTFRGLHYQLPPSQEAKLVRCVAGSVADLIVDLRRGSPTFLQHQWIELDERSLRALYVPTGLAHGFITLDNNAVVLYEMTDYYAPELGHGIRWSDPSLGIQMPVEIGNIHPRDAAYPDIDPAELDYFDTVAK